VILPPAAISGVTTVPVNCNPVKVTLASAVVVIPSILVVNCIPVTSKFASAVTVSSPINDCNSCPVTF